MARHQEILHIRAMPVSWRVRLEHRYRVTIQLDERNLSVAEPARRSLAVSPALTVGGLTGDNE